MGRTRRTDVDLPQRLFRHHGGYRYVVTVDGSQTITYLGPDREKAIEQAKKLNSLSKKNRNIAIGRARSIVSYSKEAIFQRDGYKCIYCNAGTDLVLDHFIPFAKGGATHELNMVTCCMRCNDRKGDENPALFIAKIKGLETHILNRVISDLLP